MSEYSELVITDEGLQAIRKAVADDKTLKINKVIGLINLEDTNSIFKIKTEKIEYSMIKSWSKSATLNFSIIDDHKKKLNSNNAKWITIKATNEKLYSKTKINLICILGSYEDNSPIILAVSKAVEPETIPAKADDDITYTFTADLMLNLDRTDNVTVEYSPDGLVLQETFEDHKKYVEDTYAKKEDLPKQYIKTINNKKPDLSGNVDVDSGGVNSVDGQKGDINLTREYVQNKGANPLELYETPINVINGFKRYNSIGVIDRNGNSEVLAPMRYIDDKLDKVVKTVNGDVDLNNTYIKNGSTKDKITLQPADVTNDAGRSTSTLEVQVGSGYFYLVPKSYVDDYIPRQLRIGINDDEGTSVKTIKLSLTRDKHDAWINGSALAGALSVSGWLGNNRLAKYSDLEKLGKVKIDNIEYAKRFNITSKWNTADDGLYTLNAGLDYDAPKECDKSRVSYVEKRENTVKIYMDNNDIYIKSWNQLDYDKSNWCKLVGTPVE